MDYDQEPGCLIAARHSHHHAHSFGVLPLILPCGKLRVYIIISVRVFAEQSNSK
jgi:hypothetical protein